MRKNFLDFKAFIKEQEGGDGGDSGDGYGEDAPPAGSATTSMSVATYAWPIGVPRGPGYDHPLIKRLSSISIGSKHKRSKKTSKKHKAKK